MPNLPAFEQRLADSWPLARWRDTRVLVAVSGGADSTALLRGLVSLAGDRAGLLCVAHFNHRLRGEASEGDERFVCELAATLGLACHLGTAEPVSTEPQVGASEAQMRQCRYAFLQQTAETRGARYLVTAHTADDQAETILHRVIRGTGPAGLAGIPRVRSLGPAVTVLRPMLEIRRQEVLAYLAAIGQDYREDASNRDRHFTRNRIRHELLPWLAREFSPEVVENLLRLGTVASEAQQVLDRLAGELLDRATVSDGAAQVILDCRVLSGIERHLVREVFVEVWRRRCWPRQEMGLVQWNLLAELAADTGSTSAPIVLPGAIRAQKKGEQLWLLALES